LLLSAKRNDL
jgi:hypothetical protein